jgi:two-component system sensor histidine kinase RegB
VLQNALDASPPDGEVQLQIEFDKDLVRVVIRDDGKGMNPEQLTRAGDPFFTTKEPGKGMGLGLFLARSVVERLGGQLKLESPAGRGVTATLEIPRQI